ncbi:MAG TPA: ABC transporter ATP-binding protein [Bryobacteraceae bacterium]|nr:ABC transporter ATP-binding protein [Bryobacteraceae bacterium]
MDAIRLHRVTKTFGDYTAVRNIDLAARAGSFVSVVGPSGCGKSTLLNLAAGLTACTAGSVSVFDEPLGGLNRRAGYMFQQDALLPWKTVLGNVAAGLRFRGEDASRAEKEARDWIARVGLDRFTNAFPSQLSGGMRKRVALAQSWIVNPDILLMDEPFSALDVHTRLRMETELLALWTESGKTVLFVTHDLEEALALSDDVVVLSAGPASHVVNRYQVDLGRPRDLIDIRTEPRFGELYRRIWAELKQEVLASYEREG